MYNLKIIFYIIIFFSIFNSNSPAENNVFKDIADEISGIGNSISNKTVAVFPFDSTDAKEKGKGKYFSEKIMHELVLSGRLKVVEREAIDKVIKEQELNMSGAVSAETAAMIGKLLAVDAIITGTISSRDDRIEIFVRAIDTRTGLVLKSVSRDYIENTKQKTGFRDTWKVTETAKYFLDHGITYKKLILKDDDYYELHLINNADRLVIFKGFYEIDGNNIDYRPQEMLMDGRPADLPGKDPQKGTIYIVDGKLYFTVIDFEKGNKRRLDAMDTQYRNIAERK